MTLADPIADRGEQLKLAAARSEGVGRAYCRALSDITDDWVVSLFDQALAEHAPSSGNVALLAIGGYGRGELAPYSDLDLLLVHDVKARKVAKEIEPLASAIWYPLWDSGVKLGHAVRRVDEQLSLARTDLDSATALITARPLAGDDDLADKVMEEGLVLWRSKGGRHLGELRERVRVRQDTAGDVAYRLEPDLKDGHGGLRDVQSLWWARAAGIELIPEDLIDLEHNYDVLLRARVALHLAVERPGDVLRLEDQDAAAVVGGWSDADVLMADVAASARTIAWLCDENWGRAVGGDPGPDRAIAPGVVIRNGEVELSEAANPSLDGTLVLQTAIGAARYERRIGRTTLGRLSEEVVAWPGSWPVGARDELVALLLEGHRAIPVFESLDQRDLIERLLPEWRPVKSKPQRNAYHRFTVDRHLWETAANAADLVDRVARPDLLMLGALLHDLGKGYPGDHTEVGIDLVRAIGPRIGLVPADVDVIASLVEHHLLLADVAMRRDLTDPTTINQVAEQVGSVEVLDLLHALTEADSLATGPSAWGEWKQGLVAELVARARHVLGGGDVSEVTWRLFPDADTLSAMATGETSITRRGDVILVVNSDSSGTFGRVAGVLALHGLDVLSAQAHSDEGGMAAAQFRIEMPSAAINWRSIKADLARSLDRRLAIEARLAERERTYRRRRRRTQAQPPEPPSVVFDDDGSSNATVIVVKAPTKLGILHQIAKTLGDLGLDIRHAKVQTLGMEVVDTFYVRADGAMVTDRAYRKEIQRALLHAVS